MTTINEYLAEQKRLADAATEGPWAPWFDQDGQPHMNGMLMVGNAAAVIPEGETWVEDVDVNPIAHTYTPEDRAFIAVARESVPRMIAALEAVAGVLAPHVEYQLRRLAKLGRTKSDCVCEQCRAWTAIEAALAGEGE